MILDFNGQTKALPTSKIIVDTQTPTFQFTPPGDYGIFWPLGDTCVYYFGVL